MRRLVPAIILMLITSIGPTQELQLPQQLAPTMDDIDYVERLNAIDLTTAQLAALHRVQLALQLEGVLGPEVAIAFGQLLVGLISGSTMEEAMAALGPGAQAVQELQARYGQMVETRTRELEDLLTAEQRETIAWLGSPGRGLEAVVRLISHARTVPDDQWQRARAEPVQHLAQMSAQGGGAEAMSAEAITALLDAARAMSDEDFEQARPTLAREWAAKLIPEAMRQSSDPEHVSWQVTQMCRQLVTFPRGHLLVQAKLDAAEE